MKATRKNISEVLGIHRAELKFRKTKPGNGFAIRGFLPRIALMDLMNNFHVYFNHGEIVVITPGRLVKPEPHNESKI